MCRFWKGNIVTGPWAVLNKDGRRRCNKQWNGIELSWIIDRRTRPRSETFSCKSGYRKWTSWRAVTRHTGPQMWELRGWCLNSAQFPVRLREGGRLGTISPKLLKPMFYCFIFVDTHALSRHTLQSARFFNNIFCFEVFTIRTFC